MGRLPCCAKDSGLNRGTWTAKEDLILSEYITIHGEGRWRSLPQKAGLKRCGKSCRLRWLNYLRPNIKRGDISSEEEDLIIRLHRLLGNRWSLIAGRLPDRTDNEIKNYWNSHLSKKSTLAHNQPLPKNNSTKSKPAPACDRRAFESTPHKLATAVRSTAPPNKYVNGDKSYHQDLSSSDVAETVKASKLLWCESFVEELTKEDESDSFDFAMTNNNVVESGSSSMEINWQYFSPPCGIPNLVDWQIPHFQACAENEVNTSESLFYVNDLSSSEFHLLPSPCDFREDFRMNEFEATFTRIIWNN